MSLIQIRDLFILETLDLRNQLCFAATVMFYLGKMTESGWITFILALCGVKAFHQFKTATTSKKVK